MNKECVINDQGYVVDFCDSLKRSFESKRNYGVKVYKIPDKGNLVTLHSGEFAGRHGTVMDYCPHCGSKIHNSL